jgi:hypothetical protein
MFDKLVGSLLCIEDHESKKVKEEFRFSYSEVRCKIKSIKHITVFCMSKVLIFNFCKS